MNQKTNELPWITVPHDSNNPHGFIFDDDDFHLPDVIKDEILLKHAYTKKVVKTAAIRMTRLMVVVLSASILVGGTFFVYMIFKSQSFSNFAAIVLAYVLFGMALSCLIYVYLSPVFNWVWSGRFKMYRFSGTNQTEVVVVSTLFSFILMAVSSFLFYHEHLYTNFFHALSHVHLI